MHNLSPKQKRMARIIALQVIYAQEFNGSNVDETFKHMLNPDEIPDDLVVEYGRHLCELTLINKDSVDLIIKGRLKNWDFSRITIMDRLILRMSLSEMLYEKNVPPKVSIAEGVEIAKEFSTTDSSSFINGILDAVYNQQIKENEQTL